MKIKTKKKMYIGGLLEHVRKNELRGRYFRVMDESRYIKVTPDGDIYFDVDFRFKPDDTFTVEVEEDLKMRTKLPFMVHMYIDADGKERSENCYNQSIVECKFPVECEETSLTMYSASGGDLTFIWNGRDGIPKHGTLELSE